MKDYNYELFDTLRNTIVQVKRQIYGIFLFFCFVVPIATTYSFLQFRKFQIKKEIQEIKEAGMNKEALVFLKFSKKDAEEELEWEHALEFEYNGQMYDVFESETRGDSIFYWTWKDDEETQVNEKLDELMAYALGNDPQKKEHQEHLSHFYKSLYIEFASTWKLTALPYQEQSHTYELNRSSISFPPPYPPPKSAYPTFCI